MVEKKKEGGGNMNLTTMNNTTLTERGNMQVVIEFMRSFSFCQVQRLNENEHESEQLATAFGGVGHHYPHCTWTVSRTMSWFMEMRHNELAVLVSQTGI